METVHLLNTTCNEQVDNLLRDVIGIFERAFPERIRGYYIEGSYADVSSVATSDIDMIVVFKSHFSDDEEKRQVQQVNEACRLLSSVEFDAEIIDEERLKRGIWPTFKMGSMLIYGEDIRASLPLVSLEEWTRDRMHSSYWRVVKLFHRPAVVVCPLYYPDPDDTFFGYIKRTVRLPNETEVPSTKDLMRMVGWAATAMIAYKAKKYVARKRDCYLLYREYADDAYGAQLLADIYAQCRGKWGYLIPEDAEERDALRDICARTLAFENYFLSVYKNFLLSELFGANEEGKKHALWMLGEIEYRDEDILNAVQHRK